MHDCLARIVAKSLFTYLNDNSKNVLINLFLCVRHYERKGLAYCETHYHQLFGNLCQVCNQVPISFLYVFLTRTLHSDSYPVHCTVTTIQCAVCTVTTIYCTVITIECTVTTIHCTLTIIQSTVTTFQCTVATIHCTVTTVQ
jgi:hypothetical protein